MQIGRKIYYELNTGNYICSTSSVNDGVPTTIEQDFENYTDLHGRTPSSVGYIQLEFGQFEDELRIYNCHVDIATNTIVWGSLKDPISQPLEPTDADYLIDLDFRLSMIELGL